MSLINEALKRANQARPAQPLDGPAALPMQPVTAPPPRVPWPLLLAPAALVLIGCVALWFLWRGWQLSHHAPSAPPAVVARETAPLPAPVSAPVPLTERPGPAESLPVAMPPPTLAPVTGLVAHPARNALYTEGTTPLVAPGPPPPRFTLQAIFYRTRKASVVINSKTLAIGDAVEDARVVAIGRNSVTLDVAGETNVLTLR